MKPYSGGVAAQVWFFWYQWLANPNSRLIFVLLLPGLIQLRLFRSFRFFCLNSSRLARGLNGLDGAGVFPERGVAFNKE